MLRNIYLHGELREKYGHVFRLDVATAEEAGIALASQLEGFREEVIGKYYRVVRGKLAKGKDIGQSALQMKLGKCDLHIVPVLQGEGGNARGIGKIVAGIFLIGAAFFFPGAIASIGAGVGITSGSVAGIGVSLLLGGVASMMSPSPKRQEKEQQNADSYLLSGGPNVASEGGPIPVAFGTTRIKPVIIAVGMSSEDIAV